jgi:CubicO group peptidase (beta-lactamase class C family)
VGLVIEKVSGQPFWQVLSTRVLQPLGLSHTIDLDTQHDLLEPTGYFRHALGPLRPALTEAPGWYFADGELAMPASDLLTWDIGVMNQALLAPASYAEMEKPTKLKDGKVSNYGLGFTLGSMNGHRLVSHGGEVGGFVAANYVFPDDRIAVVVLTNQEASPAAGMIARQLSALVLPGGNAMATDSAGEAWARQVLDGLQHGRIDRSRFTDNGNFYFDAQAIADYRTSLAPFGAIGSLRETTKFDRGGMTYRGFAVEFSSGKRVNLSTFTVPGGKIEQFLVEPAS